MTIDALVWVPRMMYYLGVSNKGLPEQWFTGAVVLRDLAVLALCALILRQIYRPSEDLVRFGFIDDPVGGVLDQAEDAPPKWLPAWLRPGFQCAPSEVLLPLERALSPNCWGAGVVRSEGFS